MKGIATHILGDDLSLLRRQRDSARDGLSLLAPEMPAARFRELLDAFDDRWVAAAAFFSSELLLELLQLTGEWTASYYETVDPKALGEPVGAVRSAPDGSPVWHAIAREYLERWVHHSQIRRALGLGSLADEPLLRVGMGVVATMASSEVTAPIAADAAWRIGPLVLGPSLNRPRTS